MDIQYEHNSRLDRPADYARQIDKKDSKETDDLSVDHSFSPDDNSFGVG